MPCRLWVFWACGPYPPALYSFVPARVHQYRDGKRRKKHVPRRCPCPSSLSSPPLLSTVLLPPPSLAPSFSLKQNPDSPTHTRIPPSLSIQTPPFVPSRCCSTISRVLLCCAAPSSLSVDLTTISLNAPLPPKRTKKTHDHTRPRRPCPTPPLRILYKQNDAQPQSRHGTRAQKRGAGERPKRKKETRRPTDIHTRHHHHPVPPNPPNPLTPDRPIDRLSRPTS